MIFQVSQETCHLKNENIINFKCKIMRERLEMLKLKGKISFLLMF